ncbi:hypothetical protein F2Q70_00029412 [Brassica cretica]|uniref:Uncharacterized protein n=1 Tax=Brassica cretica TaxID=69181 RepID=A0A8S9FI49_BRACR|nr:hypothetical protein F2Q70_00029412 [Brassica cretica]
MTSSPSIDTQPHQINWKRASTDIANYSSIDAEVDRVQKGDYSIGSWPDDHHLESYAVETTMYEPGEDELHEGFTNEELLNMQRRDETYQLRLEAACGRTRSSHPIDRASRPSIDINPPTSIDVAHTPSIDIRSKPNTTISEKDKFDNEYLTLDEFGVFRDPDGYARAIDGRILNVSRKDITDILQTANGAENLFVHQRNILEYQQKDTKEFYDIAGGIDKSFKQSTRNFYWEEKNEYGVYRDDQGYARDLGDAPFVLTTEISEDFWKELREMSQATYVFLNMLAYSHRPSCIGRLTTCMEEMRQDIAKIQQATDASRHTSIDRRQHASIDIPLPTSIDHRLPESINNSPPHSPPIKSQQDFHTREEIDQLVAEIYRALDTTEERLDGRCDDIYFSMDLSISALTSKIEAIQGELVEIQSYVARRPEASELIDRQQHIDRHS